MLIQPLISTRTYLTRLCSGLAITLLSACANWLPHTTEPLISDSIEPAHTGKTEPQTASEIATKKPSRPFAKETLFNLLRGELAIFDHNIVEASKHYKLEALNTKDPQVTQRAARLARYNKNINDALLLAKQWHKLKPNSKEASENLADLHCRLKQPMQALDVLENSFLHTEHGATINFAILRNCHISNKKNAEEPSQLQQVITRLEDIANKNQQQNNINNFSLVLSQALLLKTNGNNNKALEKLSNLNDLDVDPIKLSLLKAELLSELDRHKEASKILKNAIKKNPENRELRTQYAGKLVHSNIKKAETEYFKLLQETPNDVALLMRHSLVAAENGHFKSAEQSLQQLLNIKKQMNFAHYELGKIAHEQDLIDQAIKHFYAVKPGKYFLNATQTLVDLLQQNQQLEEAVAHLKKQRVLQPNIAEQLWIFQAKLYTNSEQLQQAEQTLSQALLENPNSFNLRIERSQIYEKHNQIELAINDLEIIVAKQPENAFALNALGYTLTVHTTRYAEALEYIKTAIFHLPNNAAIRDSLGWVYYKMGNLTEAQKHLETAFSQLEDDEIGAHLIEIYWLQGKQEKAKNVYKTLQKHSDQTPHSDATIKKLNIKNFK